MNRNLLLGLIFALLFNLQTSASEDKVKSYTRKAKEAELKSYVGKDKPVIKKETVWNTKINGKAFKVKGFFNEFSKTEITKLLSEGSDLTDDSFEIFLMNSKIFEKVTVATKPNEVEVYLVEYPVLGKWDIQVQGAPKPPKDKLGEAMNLKRRTHVSPDTIKSIAQGLKFSYITECATSNVEVEVYQKEVDGMLEVTFDIKVSPEKSINDVKFVGNKKLSSRKLRQAVKLRKKSMSPIPVLTFNAITEEDSEETARNLEGFAQSLGFLDFKVKSITIETSELKDKFLMIIVEEGEEYKIKEVNIESHFDESVSEKIKDKIDSLPNRIILGRAFKTSIAQNLSYQIQKELVTNKLFEYEAILDYKPDATAHEVSLKYMIKKNPNPKRIRKISMFNNTNTNDKVILQQLYFESGDILSDAAISLSKSRLVNSGLFANAAIEILDAGDGASKDIKITVEEKKQIEGNIGVSTSSKELMLNGSLVNETGNLFGTGYGFSSKLELGTSPNVMARLECPGFVNKDSLIYFEFNVHEASLNTSGLFGPKNSIEAILEMLGGVKYENLKDLVGKVGGTSQLKQDSSLKEREMSNLISPHWEDNPKTKGDREFKTSFKIGTLFNLNEHNTVGFSISLANRMIKRNTDSNELLRLRKVKDGDTIKHKVKTYADGTKTHMGVLYEGLDLDPDTSGGVTTNSDGNVVLNYRNNPKSDVTNYPALNKRIQDGKEVEMFYLGLGRSPVLTKHTELTQKIETNIGINYQYRDMIDQIELPFVVAVNTNFILGTTNAAKVTLTALTSKRLNEYLSFTLEAMVGRAFNSHYLDNFTHRDLDICATCGPVEMYSFTQLGGRNMFKVSGTVNFNVFSHHVCDLIPYVKLAFGSIWDSGIEPMAVPEYLCTKRNWVKGTIDIGQNDFSLIGVFTPGVNLKFGPVKVGLGINIKFMDQYPDLNRNSGFGGLDFSIGLDL